MTLHSSLGRRDHRRRRLLTEEYTAGAAQGAAVARTTRVAPAPVYKSEHYGDGDFLAELPRLIDLVPSRPIGFAFFFLGGLMLIAGVECLYAWMPELTPAGVAGHLAALDLAATGSLGSWFSSVVLLAAAVVAMVVYTVRRHKADDYHGRYRIWLWAVGWWLWLATATAASLHEAIRQAMTAAAGTRLVGDGSVWWIGVSLLLVATIGSRLLLDMWSCRASSATLITAWLCQAIAYCVHLDWILPETGAVQVLVRQGAQMTGDLLVLLAMGLHARYVLLDAQGLLPRLEAEAKSESRKSSTRKTLKVVRDEETEAGESDAQDEWVAIEGPHGGQQPVLRRADPAPVPASPVSAKASSASPASSKAQVAPAFSSAPVASAAKPVASVKASTAPATATKPAATVQPAKTQASADADAHEGEGEEFSDGQKLSKADRKALKKRLLEERLKREQRTAGKW